MIRHKEFPEASLSTAELIEQFEALTYPAPAFHHDQHVKLAFAYLERLPLPEAMIRFRDALQRFAAHHGATGKYHETITFAFLLLVHDRLAKSGRMSWAEFRDANEDLLEWKPSILDRFYRRETLASDLARKTYLWPDAFRAD